MRTVRKLLAVSVLAGGMLLSANGASAATFKDIEEEFWANDEIDYLVNQGIIKGYSDGVFLPNKTITKAQGAVILVRALDLKVTKKPNVTFSDVPKTHSAYNEIALAVEAGIFPKTEKFHPNEPMTRALTAQAIVNAFHLEGTGTTEFKDVPKSSASYEAIAILAENDITTGSSDGTFKPKKNVTRAEFSIFIARALNKDFLPTQYNIPQNMNPVVKLFDYVLQYPEGIPTLFDGKDDFGLTEVSDSIEELELLELKEIARLDGATEFSVKFNVKLNDTPNSLLSEGENQLYVLMTRKDYMDYKIESISPMPHLQEDDSISFTANDALQLFKEANQAYWYMISGGEGERDVTTFMRGDLEYRYMGETLNTMEKLKTYLGKTYTPEQIDLFIQQFNLITNNGKLAQPNADGGSLLNWEKAEIKQTVNSTTVKKYEMRVPLGDLDEFETVEGEFRFVEGIGWRVSQLN